MFHKKIDLRVEILSYLNDNNQIEYYPSCGFPVEIYIINQHSKINLFTTQTLNSTNFLFSSSIKNSQAIPITLKKLNFIGNYSLFDHFGWQVFQTKTKNLNYSEKFNNYIITIKAYLSLYLDTKIFQIEFLQKNKNGNKFNQLHTLNFIYPNANWLERENSEMLNVRYFGLKDTRKLLLDYTIYRGVILKNYKGKFMSNYYKNYYGVNSLNLN